MIYFFILKNSKKVSKKKVKKNWKLVRYLNYRYALFYMETQTYETPEVSKLPKPGEEGKIAEFWIESD